MRGAPVMAAQPDGPHARVYAAIAERTLASIEAGIGCRQGTDYCF